MTNSRLKPKYLKATDAPKKFSVVVVGYGIFTGIDRTGKEYEYDYVLGTVEKVPRMINLNQDSILYLSQHGLEPSEEGLKELAGCTLRFETQISEAGAYTSYRVVGIVAKKADTKS